MLKTFIPAFVLVLGTMHPAHAIEGRPVQPIELTQPADVRDVKALNETVDAVSRRVSECVRAKAAPPEQCSCRYPAELAQLRERYNGALKAHPAWRDQVLFWWRDAKQDYSYNLSMEGLRITLERGCPARWPHDS